MEITYEIDGPMCRPTHIRFSLHWPTAIAKVRANLLSATEHCCSELKRPEYDLEKLLIGMLERGARKGSLEVALPSGKTHLLGDGGEPQIRLRLRNARAVRKAWLDPALQFAELYMQDDLIFEQGDIYDFLTLVKTNGAKRFASTPAVLHELARMVHRLLRRHVLPETAKRNVAHHYDLDRQLFSLFLDADLQYSCAYYETGEETLEEAQLKKKRHIAAKMQLQPGQKVLDIGCGWGGMGLYLAQMAGANVTGVTLSEEQLAVAQRRAAESDLAGSAQFLLQDYRLVEGQFDRIVSIGMFEHVGPQNFNSYFAAIKRLLKPDGVAVVHSIVRAKRNLADPPFVGKYIFPNGHIPTLSETMPAIEKARLMVKDVEILTMHYADTLRDWRIRLHANREAVTALYDQAFFRMWDVYLAASEVSFRLGKLANFQIQLTNRHAEAPRSRSYMQDAERALAEVEARAAAITPTNAV